MDKKNDDTFELLSIFNQSSKDVNKASLLLLFHLFCRKKKSALETMLKLQWIIPYLTSITNLSLTNISEA